MYLQLLNRTELGSHVIKLLTKFKTLFFSFFKILAPGRLPLRFHWPRRRRPRPPPRGSPPPHCTPGGAGSSSRSPGRWRWGPGGTRGRPEGEGRTRAVAVEEEEDAVAQQRSRGRRRSGGRSCRSCSSCGFGKNNHNYFPELFREGGTTMFFVRRNSYDLKQKASKKHL